MRMIAGAIVIHAGASQDVELVSWGLIGFGFIMVMVAWWVAFDYVDPLYREKEENK